MQTLERGLEAVEVGRYKLVKMWKFVGEVANGFDMLRSEGTCVV